MFVLSQVRCTRCPKKWELFRRSLPDDIACYISDELILIWVRHDYLLRSGMRRSSSDAHEMSDHR